MSSTSSTLVIPHGGPLVAGGRAGADLGYRLSDSGRIVNGVYCRWRYGETGLRLENDRFGLFPVFYSTWGGRLILSTDLYEVLKAGVPAEIDYDALSVFLRLGFHVGDDTPFRHVRRLPPQASLFYTGGAWKVEGACPVSTPIYSGDRESAIDDYIDLFRESMRRLFRALPAFQLPLSGGRDSRHILLEALHQGRPPALALTTEFLPPRSDNDRDVAVQLLEGTGITHEVVAPELNLFAAGAAQGRLAQFMTAEHVWAIALRERLLAHGLPVMDGLGGDMLSQSQYHTEDLAALASAGGMDKLAYQLIKRLQRRQGLGSCGLATMLTSELGGELTLERAVARLGAELRRHEGLSNPLQSFLFSNRTRNGPGLLSLGLLRPCRVFFPYLDEDLFDFLSSLPPEFVADHQFHDLTIARAYPSYAAVPYSTYRATRKQSPMRTLSYYRQLLMRVVALREGAPVKKRIVIQRCLMDSLRCTLPLDAWWRPLLVQLLIQLRDDLRAKF